MNPPVFSIAANAHTAAQMLLFFAIMLLGCGDAASQSCTPIIYNIDTTRLPLTEGCPSLDSSNSPFFSVRGKYPENSKRLAEKAAAFLKDKQVSLSGSGYIRYGLQIGCTGKLLQIYRISQTDVDYKQAWFAQAPVEALAQFIRTLNRWNDGKSKYYLQPVNYFTYLEFRISDGTITDVIP